MFAVLGLCMVATLTAVSAHAELPQLLTSTGALVTTVLFTGESGVVVLLTLAGRKFQCQGWTAEGELIESITAKGFLGPFHLTLKECTFTTGVGNVGCTGAGDASGMILVLGEAHLIYDTLSPLGVGILFLVTPLHFTCALFGINELVLLAGGFICLIKPINTLAKHFEIVCKEAGNLTGDPSETTYWNGSGKEEHSSMLTNFGESSFESTAPNGAALILTNLEVKLDG
jgi:hypothetical protein